MRELWKRGTGAANTLKEPMGSELRDPPARMWVGRGMSAGTQTRQGRHGSLSWVFAAGWMQSSPKQPLGCIYCPSLSAWWPARSLLRIWGRGILWIHRPQKRGRKENATASGFDWMEMAAPKCELDFVVRTSNKNNNKIRVLLASPHLLRCIPNAPSLSRAASTNLSKIPKFAHPATDVTPWSAGLPTQPSRTSSRISAWKQVKSSRAFEAQPDGRVCLLSHPIP